VESYLQYQGRKFTRRFDPNCYVQLTFTLDSHDVAAGRGAYADVLRGLTHRTVVVGRAATLLHFSPPPEPSCHSNRLRVTHLQKVVLPVR
jgi:homoserine acetyltransferase